jgi:hypothetical protein
MKCSCPAFSRKKYPGSSMYTITVEKKGMQIGV